MDRLSYGFTLLEVMVGLFLLFIIFVGYEKVQLATLYETTNYYYDSIALQQMKNLSAYFMSYDYHATPPFSMFTFKHFLNHWNKENQLLLPYGQGTVTVDYPHYHATLCWGRRNAIHRLSITQ